MKKFFTILLCVALLFSLAACAAPAEDNKLVMATNATFPPYEYYDDDGTTIVGIDAEIAAKIADKLGMELEIVDIEFGSIVSGVETGKYDIGMAGMTVTDERLEQVNFSNTYAHGVQSVIVLENSPYTSYEEFYTGFDADGNPVAVKEGIKIGVQQDTTGDIYSSSEPGKWGFGEDNVIRYKNGPEAVEALKTGKVTAVIIDNEPAKSYVAANTGLKILDGAFVEEDYAIAIAKDNTKLLEKINNALVELKQDGTLDEIISRYIPAE